MLKVIISDFNGLRRVCGWGLAMRWLLMIVIRAPRILRERNLGPADRSMGAGPFLVRTGTNVARLPNRLAVANIREIWVRDVYLGHGFLSIPPGAVVVDLGANRGMFTARAASAHPDVTVIAVEPRPSDCDRIRSLLALNDWSGRVQVCNAFIGTQTAIDDAYTGGEDFRSVPWLDERGLIDRFGLTKIDFLKCDIEGSELGLLKPGSRLLAMTRQIGIEVHGGPEVQNEFRRMLEAEGFEAAMTPGAGDCVLRARRIAR